jgi:transposase
MCSINRKGIEDMDEQSLELLFAQGESIERIATRFRKDPSTISYWAKKYGLTSRHSEKHAPKGGIERERLEALVEAGMSIGTIAEAIQRSAATARHWLAKYGLETKATGQRRAGRDARDAGLVTIKRTCRHHGVTDFWLEGRGAYRCLLCRQEAVARRRRRVKEIPVREAGGARALCGYADWVGALQFHHRDRSTKSFSLGNTGVTGSLARARREARKCVLLCSNCHAEVEAGRKNVPEIDPA